MIKSYNIDVSITYPYGMANVTQLFSQKETATPYYNGISRYRAAHKRTVDENSKMWTMYANILFNIQLKNSQENAHFNNPL